MKRYVQGRTQGEGGKGEAAPPHPELKRGKEKKTKKEKKWKEKGEKRKE